MIEAISMFGWTFMIGVVLIVLIGISKGDMND